jgi:hypothetical protein
MFFLNNLNIVLIFTLLYIFIYYLSTMNDIVLILDNIDNHTIKCS